MYVEKHLVSITTNATGDGIGYTPVVTGKIISIHYVKPASGGYADGVDIDVVSADSGRVIWSQDDVNASAAVAPREPTHSTAGVAALYAAEGTAVLDYICVAAERIKITVDDGGNGGTGTFLVIVG